MITFEDYDRISDTLMWMSDSITLNFTVGLSRKSSNGERNFFHYESEYDSKYIGQNKSRSIKRALNYYFTLDNRNDFGNGLILRAQDVCILLMVIEKQILPWFFDPKKRLFKIKDDKLVIIGNFEPAIYTQSQYKFLHFEPAIFTLEGNLYKEGLRICLNSEYFDIDIDKFMGFYYTLKNTDMYSVACNMVTYVKTQPYNVNTYSRVGLGGGCIPQEEDWNSNITITNDQQNKTQNNFLNNLKKR